MINDKWLMIDGQWTMIDYWHKIIDNDQQSIIIIINPQSGFKQWLMMINDQWYIMNHWS